ncbi:MAG: DNA-directed RNA polymerase subunit beta', partial [Brevinematales bacterium]
MKISAAFGSVSIQLASPELIKKTAYGEVKKADTIVYRTQKPDRDGLFCEKIFGPIRDYECSCGKFKSIRYKGVVCDRCGVEITESKVRRQRTGYIALATPVAHIWYYRIVPSKLALILDISSSDVQSVLYFEKYIVIDPGETDLLPKQVLTDEYEDYREKYQETFVADTGAAAIKKILQNMDLDSEISLLRAEITGKASSKVDKKVLKRLELLEEIRASGNKLEWMILDVIPV